VAYLKKIKAFCKKMATPGQGSGLAKNKITVPSVGFYGHAGERNMY